MMAHEGVQPEQKIFGFLFLPVVGLR